MGFNIGNRTCLHYVYVAVYYLMVFEVAEHESNVKNLLWNLVGNSFYSCTFFLNIMYFPYFDDKSQNFLNSQQFIDIGFVFRNPKNYRI